jgi:hypothetical protein
MRGTSPAIHNKAGCYAFWEGMALVAAVANEVYPETKRQHADEYNPMAVRSPTL